MEETGQLSRVIAQSAPPSFLLGAVSGFVAVLMGRFNGILDRIRVVNAIEANDAARAGLRSDLPRLQRRAKLINDAMLLAIASAICTTLLVAIAFTSALLGIKHEPAAALMFLVALLLLCASLITLAREVRMALTAYDGLG